MSRFYLVLLLQFLTVVSFGQQELKKYLEFANKKQAEGDYVYALNYYEKAMQIDSNTIDILWNYAETLKAYKDYAKAAFYYGKVYGREGAELYPSSLMKYGLMLKQSGKYEQALEQFKLGKKKYRGDRRGYLYQKCRAEIRSCIWAKANQGDSLNLVFEALPQQINSKNAEFGHRQFKDKFIFSSLRADSISATEEVYDPSYRTHLFVSTLKDSVFSSEKRIDELAFKNAHTGNGTFSLDGNRFYFSYCDEDSGSFNCKILVAYIEKDKFVDVDTLGSIINQENASTTMPFIGEWDEKEVLFYVSNKEGGRGGMDIWYSFIENGNQFDRPRNLRSINTLDNELSPFWDGKTNTLYFSSSWYEGFGGQDVFKSNYNTDFSDPINMMEPINSPANDLYYFETMTGDTAFFSSNRIGSNFSKNPTCCSDVFLVRQPLIDLPPTIEETLEDLNRRLPVTLYFHNDIPNPRSWDTVSNVNYLDSYQDYVAMKDKYKSKYAQGLKGKAVDDAKDDIEDFFLEYVEQGLKDLNHFVDLLIVELEKGRKIELIVKGFASPLAKTDYNENLTKRRIASLVNYLYAYENGVFRKYIDGTSEDGGRLIITQIPFGENKADQIVSDNPNDQKNSVYSRAAAIERKIEIQSVDLQ
ncbi:tetratricopeptide repeat protein [Brumimicrobium aurantiacum]|uniref:Tetratricopeptide repeat protein n=1 Tax=Brumimicrobium aurantiacum TaxID=1737063 RepID=A0A3E1EVX3_9FLAO|nr:tetratricopeptide repeat protein [Brumimicrobium aurantiacum]RFC53672.1 tetratricopeptide repeat protein [Brumimicrobium aurantiacum]